ncbi:sugar ABC transporter permease [Amnibacterium sp. CER49]|uniref:carbohydrate ABC transporter permease n=1 Tax=Amnibacterium sp. CER49 TaxID=3039161 RepID=UPI00244B6913|nr:sugar ABC transporter permease [Amnibacterium sp. CER49]MDH2442852.1 sugar ABC transporter permease [Amnibacterium sp. CER49]
MTTPLLSRSGAPAVKSGSRRRRLSRREAVLAYATAVPAVVVMAVLLWVPVVSTVAHSFTKWDGITSTWTGLGNYASAFAGGQLLQLFQTNLVFLASIPGIFLICIITSVVLWERVPGWRFFRSVYYLPTVLSSAVVGILAKVLFSPQGAVNALLGQVGLSGLETDWFGHTGTAWAVLVGAFYWQTLGQGVLIFLAGLSAIPSEVVEASQIDGAGWWRRLFQVILPLLTPTVGYFLLTNVIFVLVDLFALVYVTTGGGPGGSTTPIDFLVYQKAFQDGDLGSASALAVLLLVITLVFSSLQILILRRVGGD